MVNFLLNQYIFMKSLPSTGVFPTELGKRIRFLEALEHPNAEEQILIKKTSGHVNFRVF